MGVLVSGLHAATKFKDARVSPLTSQNEFTHRYDMYAFSDLMAHPRRARR